MIKLEGSCSCGKVSFKVSTPHPYPYQLCYCSICRKMAGGGGFAINLSAKTETLKVKGKKHIKMFHAHVKNPGDKKATVSRGERSFCGDCGTALWVYDPEWPELIHPFASAIDSDLPKPSQRTHIMTEFKANWVEVQKKPKDKTFRRYPKESIEDWHKRLKVVK